MRAILAMVAGTLIFAGCNQSGENRGAYSREGGGSMEGAGGAGPGYDGTGSGRRKEGVMLNSTPGSGGK